ncbi:MAG TPA: hypothetical protein DHV60_02595 [Verrucomicrobiales bacterium]|nr:hypothetical protein [Verrucomicrobiales bacterium]
MVQKHTDTIVLGAGISGLSIAHAAQSRDHAVLVLESSDQVGGSIQSYRADGYLAERAAWNYLKQRLTPCRVICRRFWILLPRWKN